MLSAILFFAIGLWLDAPLWYFIACAVLFFFKVLRFEWEALKKVPEDE